MMMSTREATDVDVIKIDVPRNNLTPRRMERMRNALKELGVKDSDIITVTQTKTRIRYSVRTYWGY